MNRLSIVLLGTAIALGSLTGCDSSDATFNLAIEPQRSFELKDKDKKPVRFELGHPNTVEASFDKDAKKVILKVGKKEILFKGALYDAATDSVSSLSSASGQKTETGEPVGFRAGRTLVCDPNCETRSSEVRDVRCSYYDWRPVQYCTPLPNGGTTCGTRWENVLVQGWQRAEITTIIRKYNIDVALNGDSSGILATGFKTEPVSTTETKPLTTCY